MSEKRIRIQFDHNISQTSAELGSLNAILHATELEANKAGRATKAVQAAGNDKTSKVDDKTAEALNAANNAAHDLVESLRKVYAGLTHVSRAGKAIAEARKGPLALNDALILTSDNAKNLESLLYRAKRSAEAIADAAPALQGFGGALGQVGRWGFSAAQNLNAAERATRHFAEASHDATTTTQSQADASHAASQAVSHSTEALQGAVRSQRDMSEATYEGTQRFGNMYIPLSQNVTGMQALKMGVDGFTRSLVSMAGRLALLDGIKEAISGIGQALTEARQISSDHAKSAIELQDSYRELANLQAIADPAQVIPQVFKYRKATGATETEANQALKQYQGAIPASISAGNIAGSATQGVAGDFLREATRTATRVQLDPEEAALLAAKISQIGKVPDVQTGMAEFAKVVELLNDGVGNMTPLIRSALRKGGPFVGAGGAFRTMSDWAAAQSVASLSNSPAVSGSAIQRAAATFAKDQDFGSNGSRGVGDALKEAGITREDDFVTKVEKLAAMARRRGGSTYSALFDAGIHDAARVRDLAFLVDNSALLREKTDKARSNRVETVQENERLNREYFSSESARMRMAKASDDEAQYHQSVQLSPLEVRRKIAESHLRSEGKLDTAESLAEDAYWDHMGVRAYQGYRDAVLGRPQSKRLGPPISMGGTTRRQQRIDEQALNDAKREAKTLGLNPADYDPGEGYTLSERIIAIDQAARRARLEPQRTGHAKPLPRPNVPQAVERLDEDAIEQDHAGVSPVFFDGSKHRVERRNLLFDPRRDKVQIEAVPTHPADASGVDLASADAFGTRAATSIGQAPGGFSSSQRGLTPLDATDHRHAEMMRALESIRDNTVPSRGPLPIAGAASYGAGL